MFVYLSLVPFGSARSTLAALLWYISPMLVCGTPAESNNLSRALFRLELLKECSRSTKDQSMRRIGDLLK
jgi:hypothetical protein